MGRRVVALLWTLALGSAGSARAGNATELQPEPGAPIVLELFTSQGCSSCPTAERLLGRLGRVGEFGQRVVPLEFHVDYFNQEGWFDPLSARDWSVRQNVYGHALGTGSPYTPQLVVNGRVEFPGGDEQRARAEIAASLARASAARVGLTARKSEGRRPGLTIVITVEVAESIPGGRKLEVLVALFENHVVTSVTSGENGGHTLESDFVVRRLESVLSLEPKAGARRQRSVALKPDPVWKFENLGVAAFLQDPASMKIYGAAAVASRD